MKTLEQLDRRPHSVTVEVFVVELPTKKADDKDKRPDEKEFSGTIDDVAGRLDMMLKKGQVTGFKRIQLSTLEGQLGSLVLGENKPYAMGTNTTVYRNVGTPVKVTPQVTADGPVTLDLNVQDSRGRESATVTRLTEFILTSLTGKVSVAPGKAVLAKDARVISKEGAGGDALRRRRPCRRTRGQGEIGRRLRCQASAETGSGSRSAPVTGPNRVWSSLPSPGPSEARGLWF
jgi:hypothetical protein